MTVRDVCPGCGTSSTLHERGCPTQEFPNDAMALALADLIEGGVPENERIGLEVNGNAVLWSDISGRHWTFRVDSFGPERSDG